MRKEQAQKAIAHDLAGQCFGSLAVIQDYIAQQTALLTEFDESLARRWIKQITIWDDRITVELKSGVCIDVDT